MDRILNPAVAHMDESLIREMTRVAEECGAVNLAQGFPDYPTPESVLEAARKALREGRNGYTRTWGDPALRSALALHLRQFWGLAYDAEEECVITCGASEAIMATLLSLLAPGEAMVVPEPIYENYLPASRLARAEVRLLPLDPFTGRWEPAALDQALTGAKVLVLNTPANPTGKVWRIEELNTLAEMLRRHDCLLVTDETYAFITRPGLTHVPPATVSDLRGRTVTIGSFSKTYAVTGWRVGFACAPRPLMEGIRRAHDFFTICAPAPFQAALAEALKLPESYYTEMAASYRRRCDLLRAGLAESGFLSNDPDGSYFLLVDVSSLGIEDDRAWASAFARERGVAGVAGSAFLLRGMPREDGRAPDRRGTFLRLSFGSSEARILEAIRRLKGA